MILAHHRIKLKISGFTPTMVMVIIFVRLFIADKKLKDKLLKMHVLNKVFWIKSHVKTSKSYSSIFYY